MSAALTKNRPLTLSQLFWAFNWMSLQGFGGVLAIVQRELVEKKQWLTTDEFAQEWAVAQVLPGPNVVNLGIMLGDRYFGIRGAVVAVLGLFTGPLLLVIALALLYAQFAQNHLVRGAIAGMGAVVAGLIAATGIKLIPSIKKSPVGKIVFIGSILLTFALVALWRKPLIWAVVGVGLPVVLWTYWRLSKKQKGAL